MATVAVPRATDASGDSGRLTVHVAVVHVDDEICHITADTSDEGLAHRLAEYVREQVRHQLRSQQAEEVMRRLARGDAAGAVELYFAAVGRWDRERLVTSKVVLGWPRKGETG